MCVYEYSDVCGVYTIECLISSIKKKQERFDRGISVVRFLSSQVFFSLFLYINISTLSITSSFAKSSATGQHN